MPQIFDSISFILANETGVNCYPYLVLLYSMHFLLLFITEPTLPFKDHDLSPRWRGPWQLQNFGTGLRIRVDTYSFAFHPFQMLC